MVVENDEKEVNVPAKAIHLRAIPGGKADTVAEAQVAERELEALFREHHDRIFRAAYRITGSVVDAEDVLQTVFLRLSRRNVKEGINLEPNPASYLHRAAVNASLDLMRQRGRSNSVSIEDGQSRNAPSVERASRQSPAGHRQAGRKIRRDVRPQILRRLRQQRNRRTDGNFGNGRRRPAPSGARQSQKRNRRVFGGRSGLNNAH